jgi:transposase-like protein
MAPRRSWAKADNPFWSNHVTTWYRSALEAEHYYRKHDLSTASSMRWANHLLSAEDLRKHSERLRNLLRKVQKGHDKKKQSKRRMRPPRYRYGVRTDSGPVALQAFWSMHVEAMNWSGMGHAEYAAALGLSPYSLRTWRDRLEQSGNEMDWRTLFHPSPRAQLSSAANCARCKYRLTPQEADGLSNRRRFSDEQKRAMVQETEKPGVAVAEVCRRHGIATSLLFPGASSSVRRKAPQLATVALADGAANDLPALAALRDLVQPPDGMMAIELDEWKARPCAGRQSGCGEAAVRRR